MLRAPTLRGAALHEAKFKAKVSQRQFQNLKVLVIYVVGLKPPSAINN
jgi:hypothetical protein